jgi:hypothetical protein
LKRIMSLRSLIQKLLGEVKNQAPYDSLEKTYED